MARPKSKGAYVPLAAQYFMDDAVMEAGPEAELLFVRTLAFLASVPTDGFVTERQMKTVVGLGLRNVQRRLDTLLRVGLLEATSGGFVARSWQKWNRSTEEVGKLLARDRQRKAQKPGGNGENSDRNPDGIHADSELQSRAEQSSTEQSMSTSSSDASGADSVGGFSAEVDVLCELLADLVRANGHKATVSKGWRQAADRLMRIDEYTPEQIRVMIRWATADEFWAANIRSMPTLREKFSTLRMQRNRKLGAGKPTTLEVAQAADEILLQREAAEYLAVTA